MKVSVYSIYILACLMAIGAATLSGIVLANTFKAQQLQSEKAQRNAGYGQFSAFNTIVNNQMARMQTASDANIRQFLRQTAKLPAEAFEADVVIDNLNETIFSWWVPQVKAPHQLGGFGLTIMYPPGATDPKFDRTFQAYTDIRTSGFIEYSYAYTNITDGLCYAYQTDWLSLGEPVLLDALYPFDYFTVMKGTFLNDDFFDCAQPWSASDGNSYWFFTHMRAFDLHGLHMNIQTWDDSTGWQARMLGLRIEGSQFLVLDSNDMVMASTVDAEAERLAECRGARVDGAIPANCINTPASQHPTDEIREVRNALFQDVWYDLTAPAIPMKQMAFVLNGTMHMAIVGTVFSQNKFRVIAIWYQPWTSIGGSVVGLNALICIMTVVSTFVLTLLGVFAVLHPLMKLGRSMREVAHTLKDGTAEEELEVESRERSIFREVDRIGEDFETIVVDFLGFSSTKARDNKFAPKNPQKPFAVIFTDIESSTGLWGKDPTEMSRCVQVHHEIIRGLIKHHQLYEVKTIGDSFMVTTSSPTAAASFALDLQLKFLEYDWHWPGMEQFYKDNISLFCKKECLDVGGLAFERLWHGLRVRIGMHYGEGDITYDEVSKGYDYYGPVVNTAARIEALAHGGQILMSDSAMKALTSSLDSKVAIIKPHGKVPLRGVVDPPSIVEIRPVALAERTFPPLRFDSEVIADRDLTPRHGPPSPRDTAPDPPVRSPTSLLVKVPQRYAVNDTNVPTYPNRRGSVASINSHLSDYRPIPTIAEELARNHSLVRAGTLAVEVLTSYLLSVWHQMEDLMVPVGAQQQSTIFKTLAKSWGLPIPKSKNEYSGCGLRIAQRMSETPKVLSILQRRRGSTNSVTSRLITQASPDDPNEIRGPSVLSDCVELDD